MKTTIRVLIAALAVGGGVAAAVAVGGAAGGDKPITTTVKAKEPKPAETQTTTDETVTVDPGTVTVTETDDEVDEIEAVVTHEVPGIDESDIEDVDVSGDQATAELDGGGTVPLREQGGSWKPEEVQRQPRDRDGSSDQWVGRAGAGNENHSQ